MDWILLIKSFKSNSTRAPIGVKQRELLIWACTFHEGYPVWSRHSPDWEEWGHSWRRNRLPRPLRNMPAAPQSTGSAISFTGNPDFKMSCQNLLLHYHCSQGAHFSGPGGLGPSRSCLPGPCNCPHLEHLDPVAGAAGENKSYLWKGRSALIVFACLKEWKFML